MQYTALIAALVERILAGEPFGLERSAQELEGWIERPKDPKLGDLAFPCFRLAKELRKGPPQIAAGLFEAIEARKDELAATRDLVHHHAHLYRAGPTPTGGGEEAQRLGAIATPGGM